MTTRASGSRARAQLRHEALHARVAAREALLVDQVLPDRLRVAAAGERRLDQLTKRLARTRSPAPRPRGGGPRASFDPQSRWTPPPWWPVLPGSRGTPPPWWPVLAATSPAVRPCRGPRSPPPSGSALAVSRRTPVDSSIRRSDQPSRPRASTDCFLSSLKTLLIPAVDHALHRLVNVSAPTRGGRFSGVPRFEAPGSVDTPPGMAGFASESGDTPSVVAAFTAATSLLGRPCCGPRSPPPSGNRSPSPDGPRSTPRCAAATSPAAPGPAPTASCRRSRRCPSRRWITLSTASSTSRLLLVVAGFHLSLSGRFWVSPKVRVKQPTDRAGPVVIVD